MKSKTNEVLDWLKKGKPLTNLMAIQMFGVSNLPPIIFQLRAKGYSISSEIVKDEYGRKCFTQYRMTADDK